MSPRLHRLVLLLSLCAGCDRGPATEPLLVAGSTTMRAYVEPVADAFMKKHPKVALVTEGGGSAAAVIALKRGALDVATVERDLTFDEDDVAIRNYMVARDGIAIVVNQTNALTTISSADLAHVYDGTITSWSKVGGAEAPITVVARGVIDRQNKKSATRRSFNDLVLGGEEPTLDAKRESSAAELLEVVKKDPLAIGYVALRDMSSEVKALEVDRVPISRVTLLSGRYPLSRSFYLVVTRPSKTAADFVQFTLSKEGQDLLREGGLIPVY